MTNHKVVYLVIERNYDDLDTVHGVAPTYEKAEKIKRELPFYENLLSDIEEVKWYE